MKKLLTLLMVTMLVLGVCTCVASAEQIVDVEINGVDVDFDVPAQVINDRTLVPLRGIFEVVGASVDWNNDTETVTAKRGDVEISLAIGSTSLFVNGEEKTIDVPAQLVNDRTLIPARAVAESLGAVVDWDDANQTVIIKDESAPDFAALLKKSEEVKSFDTAISFDMKANAGDGYGSTISYALDLAYINEPVSFSANATTTVNDQKEAIQTYAIPNGDVIDGYFVSDDGNIKQIEKVSQAYPAENEINEPIAVFAKMITPNSSAKVVKQEKLNDKDVVKYVHTITGNELYEYITCFDVNGYFYITDIGEDLARYDDIKVCLWVDAETGLTSKVNMDLDDLLYDLLENEEAAEGFDFYIEKCNITVEVKGINTVNEITVPKDVIDNAIDITDEYVY